MLSAIVGLIVSLARGRRPRGDAAPLRFAALLSALVGVGLALRDRSRGKTTCELDYDEHVLVCTKYEDRGYATCASYEEQGYKTCGEYEDQGYTTCSEYEDRGYEACREWKKNCCDWWPCSWGCEIISWFCVAWVWVSNWVCVAWVWVTHLVCVAWYWVTHLVCVLWIWITSRICVAWAWIRFPFCWLICLIRRWFTGNEVSDSMSECIYGWTAAYRITEERDCRLHVVVRIRLVPDADVTQAQLQAAQATWEPVIEQRWSGQWPIVLDRGGCDCERYSVTLDVQWVTSNEHHVVNVHSGSGRADMGNFFLNNSGGTAAHEVGHMLGNPDEYADENCPDRTVTSDGSIMQNSQTGTVRPRHYDRFARWISARTCCDYVVSGR